MTMRGGQCGSFVVCDAWMCLYVHLEIHDTRESTLSRDETRHTRLETREGACAMKRVTDAMSAPFRLSFV